ncbi:MAG: UbiA family prenyltransferase [Verrucomicrobia bacterium]|nr:UbiA family prenyltransferase [Cytophagales bacterium]
MKLNFFYAYLKERFPFINMGLFAILFLTVFFVSSDTYESDKPFGLQELFGVTAVISFFFRLRVFDEIKDYQIDIHNHPHRILQSGKIQLKSLIVISVIGVFLEVFWSFWMNISALFCWLLAFSYTLLMRYEFFVPVFLKKHLLLYAITHLLVMPFIILWVWSAYAPVEANQSLILLALLSMLGGFAFEIARKIHSSAAERPTVDSYSKSLGYSISIMSVLLILLINLLVQYRLLFLLTPAWWSYLLIGLLFVFITIQYIQALLKPEEMQLRKIEKFVSLSMLLSFVLVILEVNF